MNRGVLALAAGVPVLLGISGNFTGAGSGTSSRASRPAKACNFSLASCPEIGCTREDSPDALTNILKKRIPDATRAKSITIDDLLDLQDVAEKKVGTKKSSLTLPQRKKLQNMQVRGHQFSEGDLVVATGFIAGDPHSNKQETVNCNLRTSVNNDIHINIAEEAGADETEGFVVEMIPQGRPNSWNDADLSKIARDGIQVMVAGQLYYDSKHRVNGDSEHLLDGEPKRLSLFEIHPVTRFSTCKKGKGCDPKKAADWTLLGEIDNR